MGDGRQIRVWMDMWLPWPSIFKVFLALPPEQVHIKVEELINTSTRVWRTDLLSKFFRLKEVSLILSMPLSFRAPDDRLVWHYDERGLFFINNMYLVARQWLQSMDSSALSSLNPSADCGSTFGRLTSHLK